MACKILPIAFDKGATRAGCAQGPDAVLRGGLLEALSTVGYEVDLLPFSEPETQTCFAASWSKIRSLDSVAALTRHLAEQAYAMSAEGLSVFLGGDHSVSAGTISGIARRAAQQHRPLFVLWLDAHPDFHTLETTESGNLHGVPLAYVSGQQGFEGLFPPLKSAVDPARICMMGIRSVDDAERKTLAANPIEIHDMVALRKHGLASSILPFLDQVKHQIGLLHVSLDFDFLDPGIVSGVGTPVAGGVCLEEAKDLMRVLSASGLMTSVDLVEYNPVLDPHQTTLPVIVQLSYDLIAAGLEGHVSRAA